MDKSEIYKEISDRKHTDNHYNEYYGGNGRIDRFLGLVEHGDIKKGGSLLDVGGSHGDLVQYALREGLFDQGTVIDISSLSVEVAKKRGIQAVKCDVDKDGLLRAANTTDCIAALDFIEHIVDPENFARECFRVLKPGGTVFINTPNILYWKHLEEMVVHGRFPHTSGDVEVYHGGHLAFYCYDDMVKIFSSAGFHNFSRFADTNTCEEPIPNIWVNLMKTPDKFHNLSNSNLLFLCNKP